MAWGDANDEVLGEFECCVARLLAKAGVSLVPWLILRLLIGPWSEPNSLPGWLFSSVAEILILYFWIVQVAIGKNYDLFSQRLDRPQPPPER